ncbi:MAG: YjjG family noncanonical pyrimidine nucleotidase [Prevotellaceae bacterium]|jgi:putative hydrolase of the HAD superfamily|nr:YjjG family noncanonical pyrimidine nucleotidase [Prevotellaceae bacterium]
MIKHVFFDLDRTLWDYETNSKLALKDLFYKYNIDKTGADFDEFVEAYSQVNTRLWKEYGAGHIDKEKLRKTRFRLTLKKFKITNKPLADKMDEEYISISPLQTALTPHAEKVLNYLSAKAYKLYIITNGFTETQNLKLHTCGLETYFEHVYTSEATGKQKPSPEIFRYVMKDIRALPEDCIMIGDDFEVDILGAASAGIAQIYYNPEGVCRIEGKATYEISSLDEIEKIL